MLHDIEPLRFAAVSSSIHHGVRKQQAAAGFDLKAETHKIRLSRRWRRDVLAPAEGAIKAASVQQPSANDGGKKSAARSIFT